MSEDDDPRTVLEKATDAVHGAAKTVQSTTASIAEAIDDSRRSGGMLNHVSEIVRQVPLRALILAFVTGWIVARRRS